MMLLKPLLSGVLFGDALASCVLSKQMTQLCLSFLSDVL